MGEEQIFQIHGYCTDPADNSTYNFDTDSQLFYTMDEDGNSLYLDSEGYLFWYDEQGEQNYIPDAQGNYQQVNISNLDMHLRILVDHTEQKKLSKDLYYAGGYQKLALQDKNGDGLRSYNYADPYTVEHILTHLQNTHPMLYDECKLSAFHQMASERKALVLNHHQRAPEHIEIDPTEYKDQIAKSRKERFAHIRVERDGIFRHIKLDNRHHGTDADLSQNIAAEFFRCFFNAPKSRMVYAKGTNEIIGVETDEMPGISLNEYAKQRYDQIRERMRGLKPCMFGINGNYNVEYPQELVDELVEAGLNEGYAIGVGPGELDAHWANFIFDPETKILSRIDFDLTFARLMFPLQENPLYDDQFRTARNCDVGEGYSIVAKELAENFTHLDKASAYRPYRWINAHAFGHGQASQNKNTLHPKLAQAVAKNDESKTRRYVAYLGMMLASAADIARLVTPFTCDTEKQQSYIQYIKGFINDIRQEMINYPDFQDFLASDQSNEAIQQIIAKALDYYLDPLESVTFSVDELRKNINSICNEYEKLSGKTVSPSFLARIFYDKTGFSYHPQIHTNVTCTLFHLQSKPDVDEVGLMLGNTTNLAH